MRRETFWVMQLFFLTFFKSHCPKTHRISYQINAKISEKVVPLRMDWLLIEQVTEELYP